MDELLLPRLELHFGTQAIDLRGGARVDLIPGLIGKRLRRLDLRFRSINAGLVGDGLQIREAHGQHDQVARVFVGIFGGLHALAGRARSVDRLPIEQGLGHRGARVKIRERANGRRYLDSAKTGKTEFSNVNLRIHHVRCGGHMRQ